MDQLFSPLPVAFGSAVRAARYFPQQPGGFSYLTFVCDALVHSDGGWQRWTHQLSGETVAGAVVGDARLLDVEQCSFNPAPIRNGGVHQALQRIELFRILLERRAVRGSEPFVDLHG